MFVDYTEECWCIWTTDWLALNRCMNEKFWTWWKPFIFELCPNDEFLLCSKTSPKSFPESSRCQKNTSQMVWAPITFFGSVIKIFWGDQHLSFLGGVFEYAGYLTFEEHGRSTREERCIHDIWMTHHPTNIWCCPPTLNQWFRYLCYVKTTRYTRGGTNPSRCEGPPSAG